MSLFPSYEECVKESRKHFGAYRFFPGISSIIIFLIYFVYGIIDACIKTELPTETLYGIMQLRSSFLCWLIWVTIGFLFSILWLHLAKVFISSKILQIECLIIIAKNTANDDIKKKEIIETLCVDNRKWQCKFCGYDNSWENTTCESCGHLRSFSK